MIDHNNIKDNPLALNGFMFLEWASLKLDNLEEKLNQLGFALTGRVNKNIRLYTQGQIKFLVSEKENGHAASYANDHGTSVCAIGFAVKDSKHAYKLALSRGAEPALSDNLTFDLPALQGINGSVIYLCDPNDAKYLFATSDAQANYTGLGLTYIDHLTHNVHRGHMRKWSSYYQNVFNFREIRYFDIKGLKTGLVSQAMCSPCGKIRIPINESTDANSQIEEFIREYHGEGIQHIALGTDNIYDVVEKMRRNLVNFLSVPENYFDHIYERVPWHKEDIYRLKKNAILLDGGASSDQGLLLQIFTENFFGPVFFEIIQRKGDEGFGEGNFKALFEAIERDQIRRGTLK